jgi:hypothetical protein
MQKDCMLFFPGITRGPVTFIKKTSIYESCWHVTEYKGNMVNQNRVNDEQA